MMQKPTYEELEHMVEELEKKSAVRMNVDRPENEGARLFEDLFQHMPIACFTFDQDGRFLSWNSAAEHIYGYTETEAVGSTAYELIVTPETLEATEQIIERVFKGEFVKGSEWQDRNKDGEIGWRMGNTFPLMRPDGTVICGVNVNLDITDRKLAEESLKRTQAELEKQVEERTINLKNEIEERTIIEEALNLNESRLEALLELSHMYGASIQDLADFALEEAIRLTKSEIGYLAFMNENETTLTMYAWSREAMKQCEIIDKPIEYVTQDTGLWGEAVRQRKPVITNDYQAPNPYKKGYPVGHVLVKCHMNIPVFDGQNIVAVAGVGNKNSEYDESDVRQLTLLMDGMWKSIKRRRTENALKESEERISIAAEIANLGVWEWRINENKLLANQKFFEITGLTSKEADNFTLNMWLSRIHPDEKEKVRSIIKDLSVGKLDRSENQVRLRHPQTGERWLYGIGRVVERTKEGKPLCMVGIHQDITSRKQAEAERERLIKGLEKALSEVKALSGLLPICASCKKIRDDKGYWNQIESYISKHSEAQFSHGICPGCAKKLYPDIKLYDE